MSKTATDFATISAKISQEKVEEAAKAADIDADLPDPLELVESQQK